MAVPVMKKTGKSKEKEEEEGISSSPLLMVNNNGKGKQVQVEVTVEKRDSHPSSSSLLMVNNNNGKGKQVHVFVDNPLPLPLPAPAPFPTLPQFPPGFRFSPKESELIIDYLQKKVLGKPIDYYPNPVVERDLYGNEEPWQICHALGKAEHEDLYVFTLLRSKSGGAHMSRRAGNGTWKGDHKAKDCYDDMGTLIGCRTTLTFFHSMTTRTPWIMHQYTLPGQHQGWTLCRIHNEDQAKKKRKCSATTYAPQHPFPSFSSSPPPPQPLHYDAPAPDTKRPRTNDQTPSSSSSQPTQSLPSNDCGTGFFSFLLNNVDYYHDMDPLPEISHTTASHITLSKNSATELASSSSSHPQQDLPSSSQPQGPDTFACNNNDCCPWLIDEGVLPF